MTRIPSETVVPHRRLLKCTLEVENARAYWQRVEEEGAPVTARQAFDEYWFGARSLTRVVELLANFRARFDAFPAALRVLRAWPDMDAGTRRLICHWHLQLSDPLYRAFTGTFLVARHEYEPATVSRDVAVKWVGAEGSATWAMSTRIQFASKLLSSAFSAGLLASSRDPRALRFPSVGDDALAYVLYLLRDVSYEGTLLDNPYLASVGLDGALLESRLRALPGLSFRRQGALVDVDWQFESLERWAEHRWHTAELLPAGGVR